MSTSTIQILLNPFSIDGVPGVTLYHEELLYTSTNADGQKIYQVASATDGPGGQLLFSSTTYTVDTISQEVIPGSNLINVASGANSSSQWSNILQAGAQINALDTNYWLADQNCFSAVSTELTAAGLSVPVSDIESLVGPGYLFGIYNILPIPLVPQSADNNIVIQVTEQMLNQLAQLAQLDDEASNGFNNLINSAASSSALSNWVSFLLGNAQNQTDDENDPFGVDDPLAISTNGQAVTTTSLANGAFVDYRGTGFEEQSSWFSSNAGILVDVTNPNGTLNNGFTIIGSSTTNQNGNVQGQTGLRNSRHWIPITMA